MSTSIDSSTRGDLASDFQNVFDAARWDLRNCGTGVVAEARSCILCGLAKRMKSPNPCRLYCLEPIESRIRNLDSNLHFSVRETLWEGQRCLIEVSSAS